MGSFKAGFISIIGRPNVGKSTLFNRIIGEKVAIVTPTPQTTRHRILGIKNVEGGQLIFLDTPGLHEGRTELNRRMVQTALASSRDADVILFMIEAVSPQIEEDQKRLDSLKKNKGVPFLVINKIDLIRKELLLPLMDQYQKLHPFEKIIPVSAASGEGVDLLVKEILNALPESPPYYPEDMFTDQTERAIVSEMIREQVIHQTYQEIPHATAVTIESFKEHPEKGLVVIQGTIYVEKESQRKILIGKGGQRLKKIGEAARKEIEAFLGKRVFLELWVKVVKDWTRDPHSLDELGYLGP
ncbi:MAG: GTPase Era [Desulfobacterota bacterium]|nr:GTPase Era [Thermodesulfobacteriota bacterium]